MTGSLAGSDAIVYNVVADCNCTSGCLESQVVSGGNDFKKEIYIFPSRCEVEYAKALT